RCFQDRFKDWQPKLYRRSARRPFAGLHKVRGDRLMLTAKSFPFSLALDDRYVSVDRQISKPFHRAAGKRPFHLYPIELLSLPNDKHNPRLMRRHVGHAAQLPAAALEIHP